MKHFENMMPALQDSILPKEGQDILFAVEQDWRRMNGHTIDHDLLTKNGISMDEALPHTFIIQRYSLGAARVRVAGQKLHEMVQADPRGLSFGCFFTDGTHETIMELVETAIVLPAIIRIPLMAPRTFGLKPARAEAVLLPMRDAKGDVNRIIGAIVSEQPLPKRAIKWDLDTKREIHCEEQQNAFPERRMGPRVAKAQSMEKPNPTHAPFKLFAERNAKATSTASRRAHLRLVVDNTAQFETA